MWFDVGFGEVGLYCGHDNIQGEVGLEVKDSCSSPQTCSNLAQTNRVKYLLWFLFSFLFLPLKSAASSNVRQCVLEFKTWLLKSYPGSPTYHPVLGQMWWFILCINLTGHRAPRLNMILGVSVRMFPHEVHIWSSELFSPMCVGLVQSGEELNRTQQWKKETPFLCT